MEAAFLIKLQHAVGRRAILRCLKLTLNGYSNQIEPIPTNSNTIASFFSIFSHLVIKNDSFVEITLHKYERRIENKSGKNRTIINKGTLIHFTFAKWSYSFHLFNAFQTAVNTFAQLAYYIIFIVVFVYPTKQKKKSPEGQTLCARTQREAVHHELRESKN